MDHTLVPVDPAGHLEEICRLARERDLAALGRVDTGRGWIAGRLATVDPRHDARLLLAPGRGGGRDGGGDGGGDGRGHGRALGAVWVSRASGRSEWDAELVLDPVAGPAGAAPLLDFAQWRCRTALTGRAEGLLSCYLAAGEHGARAAVLAAGFTPVRGYLRMSVGLAGVTSPAAPAGARVRTVAGERDLRAFHAVKNAAYSAEEAGKEEDGFEEWLAWLESDPGTDPTQRHLLELDGVPAGFANVTDRMREPRDAAYLRQIGVIPAARGRGLGRFLLRTAMAAARRAGRGAMVLTVEADNTAALALYRGLGWRVEARFDDFHRPLGPLGPLTRDR